MKTRTGAGRWTVVLTVAVMIMGAVAARAQDPFPAGVDCWSTDAGTTTSIPELPAGFFGDKAGTPSDLEPMQVIDVIGLPLPPPTCPCTPTTVIQWVDVHGTPVDPDSIHRVSAVPFIFVAPYDTCVARTTDAMFPGGVGVPDSVDIEIIALSLTSVSPITVTYGAEPPSLFDVFITLDPGVSPQSMGELSFTPTQVGPPTGDASLVDLPVDFRFEFREVGGGGTFFLPGNITFVNNNTGTFGPPPDELPAASRSGLLLLTLVVLASLTWWIRRRPASPTPS